MSGRECPYDRTPQEAEDAFIAMQKDKGPLCHTTEIVMRYAFGVAYRQAFEAGKAIGRRLQRAAVHSALGTFDLFDEVEP